MRTCTNIIRVATLNYGEILDMNHFEFHIAKIIKCLGPMMFCPPSKIVRFVNKILFFHNFIFIFYFASK